MPRKFNLVTEIRGALRQIFRKSDQRKAAMKLARVETPKLRKDGTKAKRPTVDYKCARCGGYFKPEELEVDHIDPVGPAPGTRNARPDLTWDEFIKRMFCEVSNLQVLCRSCHKAKTYNKGA